MIIKNFFGTGIEIFDQEHFRISWDYISLPSGEYISAKSFYVPDALVTEEFILSWDLVNNQPLFLAVEDALNSLAIKIAWFVDTYFLEYYFTASDEILSLEPFELRLPKAYFSQQPTSITANQLFRASNKNYPGQPIAGKVNSSQFPGLKAGVGAIKTDSDKSASSNVTEYFTRFLAKKEVQIRNSWETDFGPNSGSEFSFNMFGLDREDYRFLLGPNLRPVLKDVVFATLPVTSGATSYIYLALEPVTGRLCHSLNTVTDFKYGPAITPADIKLSVFDYTDSASVSGPVKSPVQIYSADLVEATALSYQTLAGVTQAIVLAADRYTPEITVTNPITASDFKRGFNYRFLQAQTVFPAGFISTGPNTGRYPATGIRPWDIKAMPLGVFNGKNTRHSTEFFFKLYKLRKGQAYNYVLDTVNTGPADFEQLLIESLPTSVVEATNSLSTLATTSESIIGSTDNAVFVRLPFSYTRGSLEWELAHSICKAFLQNYTIGYHQFAADYSVADEPVFDEPVFDLIVIRPLTLSSFINVGATSG